MGHYGECGIKRMAEWEENSLVSQFVVVLQCTVVHYSVEARQTFREGSIAEGGKFTQNSRFLYTFFRDNGVYLYVGGGIP